MKLTLNKQDSVYTAEFVADGNFALHAEIPKGGSLTVSQRSADTGHYAHTCTLHTAPGEEAVDADFTASVWPKHIQLRTVDEGVTVEVSY